MKTCWLFLLFLTGNRLLAQPVIEKLAQAIAQLESDTQLQHAIIGFSVYNTKTGLPLYEHNAATGLAPASTQKILTSCAAFDLLGSNFRYTTEIGYKDFKLGSSRSYFVIKPSCDPTFGSSRFASTRPATILKNIITSVKTKQITPVSTQYVIADSAYGGNAIPGGWIWEDIGNYYGAPAQSLNWLENQYDIVLKSGNKPGDKVAAVETRPAGLFNGMRVNVSSAKKGSGDNSIVFLNYGSGPSLIQGTIPLGEDSFTVSASIPNPQDFFIQQLNDNMKAEKISMLYGFSSRAPLLNLPDSLFNYIELYKHLSPTLDSINYWFLKKSINLYGEALIKTMAFAKYGYGSTENGVETVKDFWEEKGIERSELHISDGSGLSPQNRVTPNALAKALLYARTRPWFNSFYDALPEHNGMRMKSGSINGARAYAGYQLAKDGTNYTFAIIVNNYDGKASEVVKKMYLVLDNLK